MKQTIALDHSVAADVRREDLPSASLVCVERMKEIFLPSGIQRFVFCQGFLMWL